MDTVRERRTWQREHLQRVIAARPQAVADAPTAARAVGISQKQLDNWSRRGYLNFTQTSQGRQGSNRRWSVGEQNVARIMGRLTRVGFSVESAARIARQHVEHPSFSGTYQLAVGIDIAIRDFVS